MDIVLLGSGNVATHFGKALVRAGHRVAQVYSRTKARATVLAASLNAQAIDNLSAVDPTADIYLFAVKDDVIGPLASQLPALERGIVAHTAGSVDMAVLAVHAQRCGVIYPVQTFSLAKPVDFSLVPLAVEASDKTTYHQLSQLVAPLSTRIFPCDSRQRLALHVAAVFACNFTNHLYAIGADLVREYALDFDLLRPLILETAQKVMAHAPRDVQTGPAVRNDVGTMQRHIELLEASHPALVALYRQLSERIYSN